jgi:hypothetical protein
MPTDSATGATPKLRAIAGTAVVMTVASRFSMKNAAATSRAIRRPRRGSTAGGGGGAEGVETRAFMGSWANRCIDDWILQMQYSCIAFAKCDTLGA